MFQLTKEEFEALRLQIETLEKSDNSLRSQIVTSKGRGGIRYLPYAFTEQVVAMLSGVRNSDKAIKNEHCYNENFCGNKTAYNATG